MRYVDVNVFIYWLNGHPKYGETAAGIIERIDLGERAVTSALTPWLIHVVFKRDAVEGYSFPDMMARLTSVHDLRFASVELSTYGKAAELAGDLGLNLEDAVHLATALDHGADAIYSNDTDFDKGPIKRVFE